MKASADKYFFCWIIGKSIQSDLSFRIFSAMPRRQPCIPVGSFHCNKIYTFRSTRACLFFGKHSSQLSQICRSLAALVMFSSASFIGLYVLSRDRSWHFYLDLASFFIDWAALHHGKRVSPTISHARPLLIQLEPVYVPTATIVVLWKCWDSEMFSRSEKW